MGLVDNKVVLITGGSRGIGAELVKSFAKAGAKVVFTYRSSKDAADALIAECDGEVSAFQSDASNYEQAEALIKSVMEKHERIDVLINNAGITKDNLLLRMNEEQWDSIMDINLKSVFNLTKHCLKPMLKQRAGSIINMSSVVGVFGNAGQSNYAASKAGIIGFTKSIAKEIGSRGVRCNAIAPGFIATEMTEVLDDKVKDNYIAGIPLKRLGSTDDVSNLSMFLASDQSSYITGQVISVCGGLNI